MCFLFLLISVIGICVHFNIVKIPFVVNLLERTEPKQEFGDFSGELIGESYFPKEENMYMIMTVKQVGM